MCSCPLSGLWGKTATHGWLSTRSVWKVQFFFIPGADSEPLNPKPGMVLLPQKNNYLAVHYISFSFYKFTHSHSSYPNCRPFRRLADCKEAWFQGGRSQWALFLMSSDEVAVCPFQSTTSGDIRTPTNCVLQEKSEIPLCNSPQGQPLPFSTVPFANRMITGEFTLDFDFALGCT